jgi:hemerythrin-like metal-binding protein
MVHCDGPSHDRKVERRSVSDWEPEMSVGVELLDVHHRQVWRRVRHLARSVSEGEVSDVRSSLRLLHGYLCEHHAAEERWMEGAGYPGAREHVRAHAAIVERAAEARADDAVGAERRLLAAADWLARALAAHMQTDDLKLGRFWTARENLRKLAEAGPGVGAALTPIPGMLRTLTPVPRADRDDEPAAKPAPRPPPDR